MPGVLICHGSPTVRERLATAVVGVPALMPARTAADAEEALYQCRRGAPILILVDAKLPGAGIDEVVRRLRTAEEDAVVVLLAEASDEAALELALGLGVRGFLSPRAGRAELAAIVAYGLLSPGGRVRGNVTASALLPSQPVGRPEAATEGEAGTLLSQRELEVLVGMSHGRSNAQIGAGLFLSEDTVKTHARRLFRKLGANDRAQAVAIGLRRGLIR